MDKGTSSKIKFLVKRLGIYSNQHSGSWEGISFAEIVTKDWTLMMVHVCCVTSYGSKNMKFKAFIVELIDINLIFKVHLHIITYFIIVLLIPLIKNHSFSIYIQVILGILLILKFTEKMFRFT